MIEITFEELANVMEHNNAQFNGQHSIGPDECRMIVEALRQHRGLKQENERLRERLSPSKR